jgi:integrase
MSMNTHGTIPHCSRCSLRSTPAAGFVRSPEGFGIISCRLPSDVLGAAYSRLHEKGDNSTGCRVPPRARRGVARLHRRGRIAEDRKGWLFRTARGHNWSALSDKSMSQPDAWRMIRRRAAAAGIAAEIGCHTFRATGITAYLANGDARKPAQEMAAHESPRTTKLYDQRRSGLPRTK